MGPAAPRDKARDTRRGALAGAPGARSGGYGSCLPLHAGAATAVRSRAAAVTETRAVREDFPGTHGHGLD